MTVRELREALEALPFQEAEVLIYVDGWWKPREIKSGPHINLDKDLKAVVIFQGHDDDGYRPR
jgi:hypothetical protein